MPTRFHLSESTLEKDSYKLTIPFYHNYEMLLTEDYTVQVTLPLGASNIKVRTLILIFIGKSAFWSRQYLTWWIKLWHFRFLGSTSDYFKDEKRKFSSEQGKLSYNIHTAFVHVNHEACVPFWSNIYVASICSYLKSCELFSNWWEEDLMKI